MLGTAKLTPYPMPPACSFCGLPLLHRYNRKGEFDDMVIAPVFGFDDYQDYYRKTQSGQFLKDVRVPFLAVQVTCLNMRIK